MIQPKISVLLPVRNAEATLRACLLSMQVQTFIDFEVLIVDDGSSDGSAEIARRTAQEDKRFRSIAADGKGLVSSLNQAISLARGEYLARMDADDLCHPQRFAIQAAFLAANQHVQVLGSSATLIDLRGNAIGQARVPPNGLVNELIWLPRALIHPTVMIRASAIIGEAYSEDFPAAEDYELWMRLAKRYPRGFYNLRRNLLNYRVWPGSQTGSKRDEQLASSCRAFHAALGTVLGSTTCNELFGVGPLPLSILRRWQTIGTIFPNMSTFARLWEISRYAYLKAKKVKTKVSS